MKPDDALAPVREAIAAGVSLRELAAAADVPRMTIHRWLHEGLPDAIIKMDRLQKAAKRLARAAEKAAREQSHDDHR